MRLHYIPWLIFWVPVVAVHGAYAIGLWQGVAHECNPYIHGCTTISRAAREGDAIFLFRGLMMPLTAFLAIFWYLQSIWLRDLRRKSQRYIFIIGAVGALFLILYVNFLGTDGDFNEFMRRYGVTLYFGLTGLAQMMSIASLHKVVDRLDRKVKLYMYMQLGLIILCWVLAMINVAANVIGYSNIREIESTIEWQFCLLLSLYFAFAALMWKRAGFRLCENWSTRG